MYESQRAVEAAKRTKMVEGAAGRQRNKHTNDGGHRRKTLAVPLARYLCPYHGLVRVGDGAGASTAHSSSSRGIPALHTGDWARAGGRLFLALGDPREGMRSPCTLTIKIGTDGESVSVLPPQVR